MRIQYAYGSYCEFISIWNIVNIDILFAEISIVFQFLVSATAGWVESPSFLRA